MARRKNVTEEVAATEDNAVEGEAPISEQARLEMSVGAAQREVNAQLQAAAEELEQEVPESPDEDPDLDPSHED